MEAVRPGRLQRPAIATMRLTQNGAPARYRAESLCVEHRHASINISEAKWWNRRVTLPQWTACKAGALLVEPRPHLKLVDPPGAAPGPADCETAVLLLSL